MRKQIKITIGKCQEDVTDDPYCHTLSTDVETFTFILNLLKSFNDDDSLDDESPEQKYLWISSAEFNFLFDNSEVFNLQFTVECGKYYQLFAGKLRGDFI